MEVVDFEAADVEVIELFEGLRLGVGDPCEGACVAEAGHGDAVAAAEQGLVLCDVCGEGAAELNGHERRLHAGGDGDDEAVRAAHLVVAAAVGVGDELVRGRVEEERVGPGRLCEEVGVVGEVGDVDAGLAERRAQAGDAGEVVLAVDAGVAIAGVVRVGGVEVDDGAAPDLARGGGEGLCERVLPFVDGGRDVGVCGGVLCASAAAGVAGAAPFAGAAIFSSGAVCGGVAVDRCALVAAASSQAEGEQRRAEEEIRKEPAHGGRCWVQGRESPERRG